jgi:putative ABC transport system permease protein
MTARRRAPWLYRWLVALYPRAFRKRFGPEIEAAAADLLDSAKRLERSRTSAWRLLLRDLATSLVREHTAVLSSARPASQTTRQLSLGDRMNALLQDIRFALRTLRRAPTFAATVILSFAIGIGANTLVYSLVDGVVLRPFAFPDADRLVAIGVFYPKTDEERRYLESLSPAEYEDIRSASTTLEKFFAFDLGNRNISGGDRPERVFTAFVWDEPFTTIGMRPALGRGFTAQETTGQAPPVVVLSHRIWQSRFAGDSALVGRTILVNGQATTVVGIMPRDLLLLGTDLWIPMGTALSQIPRQVRQFAIVARMKDGVTTTAVNAELSTIASRVESTWKQQHPEYEGWSLAATPWADVVVASVRPAALVMLGAVAFVLLLACANIASVMLARSSARQLEVAVRRALGAGTARLTRQLLTESTLLAVVGAVLGVAAAFVLLRPATSLFPSQLIALGVEPSIDTRVLLLTLAVSIGVGILAGLAPVSQLRRMQRSNAVSGARLTSGAGERRLRQAFTVVQIAVAVVLLSGAAVMVRSFDRLQRVDAGFDTSRMLTMRLSLAREKYAMGAVAPFFEMLAERLEAVPGVARAGAATQFPPDNGFSAPLLLAGEEPRAAETRMVDVTNATTGYFAALGVTLRTGRLFGAQDGDSAPRVAILNASAARRYFGTASPVGRRVALGDGENRVWHEVVGVVSDTRNRGLDQPTSPEVFVPVRQQRVMMNNQLFLVIRTRLEPLALLPAVRGVVQAIDPDQPVYSIRTVEDVFAESAAPRRAAALLLTIFGGIALALAAVGIYGLLSYIVNARRHEIGIRLALGAVEGSVLRMVLKESTKLVGVGVVLGLAGVIALRGALATLVFELEPADPMTLMMAVGVLTLTALVACWAPARRAARVEPVEALRLGD